MKHQLLVSLAVIIIAIIAASFVMIVHELVKAVAYLCYIKNYNKKYDKQEVCLGVFNIFRYIDPIGMIFAVTNYGIFSKQYPFIIRSRKASFLIGLFGFLSLIFTFGAALLVYRLVFGHNIHFSHDEIYIYYIVKSCKYLLEFIAFFSLMLILINLYPLATFDISLITASVSPILFIKQRRLEIFYKLAFLLLLIMRVYYYLAMYLATLCLKG